MLIYVESKAFPYRTFTVRTQSSELIARIRAQLLHILYELGREDHQFRLRFKGQFLRDAFTVEDYGIVENSIIKMIPLSKRAESLVDLQSDSLDSAGLAEETVSPGIMPDIKEALQKEVRIFDKREDLIYHFNGLLYLNFMAVWLSFLTSFWYSGFWVLVLYVLGSMYCPAFTRLSGFVGKQSVYKTEFCIGWGMFALVCMVTAIYLSIIEWTRLVGHGCKDWVFEGDCSHQVVYSAMFFGVHALILMISIALLWRLLWNIKVEYGDYVEKYLVRSRDIEEVMKAATSIRLKERRTAAFELATMAASGDDNKFRIVAEGGLGVLIRMALCKDVSTQEHALEAIVELLTVPAILDNFVEMGGIRMLTALLHSTSGRLVSLSATALNYIVSDVEENKMVVVAEHGLDDLAHAASNPNLTNQRLVAGIYLELAFNADVRAQMASLNTPAQALVKLCGSSDADTQRYSLQTLELLAIESPEMICAQGDLLSLLLRLPSKVYDPRVLILAGKILLYYAESREMCEVMMDRSECKESLFLYTRTRDAILQKVVVKVIYSMLEVAELRYRARHMRLDEVLKYTRENAVDRECWDMADQALQLMNLEEGGLLSMPSLSTQEKIDKMDAQTKADIVKKRYGSMSTLGSRVSLRSLTDDIVKKAL